ncbi:thiamine pyrophosphate-dependent dehydrogenase E1 component subunit alpha [Desulfurella sp.]|uniref:thiamine pyrophosphate-dependent dehydrogenase E1 component subunit alpha n=1 Tax=Desulfurella sp. TaxID=1962857 RepID=UPI003D0E249A
MDKAKLISMYELMVRIRTFEERVRKEFATGNIGGFIHLYSGEEATAVGVCSALRKDDYIISTHRGHGHVIAKGGKTDRMMAELYGKITGYNKGKGGSMHIADVELGILGANGIVGAGITIANGAALAAQMKGTDQVCACFFSDGASNTTRFHEGINLASIWKLPVVFVIENNGYAESTPVTYSTNIKNLAERACAYGIPGVTVDGNDVLAVYEAAKEAVERARKKEGPTLLECKTYRYHGHFEGDTQEYKPKEEVEEWLKKDPIPRFASKLINGKVATESELKEIEKRIEQEIEDAVKFAVESPYPDVSETFEDVWA